MPARPASHQGGRLKLPLLTALFVVFCCSVLAGSTLLLLWQNRQAQRHQLELQASNLSHTLARFAESSFDQTDTVLDSALMAIDELQGHHRVDNSSLHRLLRVHVQAFPALDELLILRADGRVLASSRLHPRGGHLAFPAFFKRQARLGKPLLAWPVQVSQDNDHWMIPLGIPLRLRGYPDPLLLVAQMPLQRFERFFRDLNLPPETSLAMLLDDGQMLLRHPALPGLQGRDMSGSPIVRHALQHNSGVLWHRSELDAVQRVYAYRHLQLYPLMVTAALAEESGLGAWNTLARYTLGLLCLALVCFTVLGCYLLQQLQLRSRGEQDLQRAKQALEVANANLIEQALHDELTGLANRRLFDRTLRRECAQARRNGTRLALLMMDIDQFKAYNDHFGHPAGDACLRQVGACLSEMQQRPGDLAVRYGGEEFALILPGCDGDGARQIAERVQQAVAALQIEHPHGLEGRISLSIGVALLAPEDSANELIDRADRALYQAKHNGRDRVEYLDL